MKIRRAYFARGIKLLAIIVDQYRISLTVNRVGFGQTGSIETSDTSQNYLFRIEPGVPVHPACPNPPGPGPDPHSAGP